MPWNIASMRLFLSGDVMTGRGIDQILPAPSRPGLHEPALRSAAQYVELAERRSGPIPRPVDFGYVWGDTIEILTDLEPRARIVNLETSITVSEEALLKGINYRMHPANVPVLLAAGIDCAVLANNHVLDWGEPGLLETLDVLAGAGIRVAGAGRDRAAAEAPAVLETGNAGRVLVFACGTDDSGIPPSWAAGDHHPGVNRLPDLSERTADRIGSSVRALKRPGDVAVLSIHWGGNWGYDIPAAQRRFAHALVDRAGIDVVHGHSSHHPRAIEVYHGRLVLYGSGDLLNDYEGIEGYEEYRDDLSLMYFPVLDPDGALDRLEMVPLQIRKFRLNRPTAADRAWLARRLDRECRRFGSRVVEREERLVLEPG